MYSFMGKWKVEDAIKIVFTLLMEWCILVWSLWSFVIVDR